MTKKREPIVRGEPKHGAPFTRVVHPAAAKKKHGPLPRKQAPKVVLLRDKLVDVELALAKLHIHEVGGNNHGPWMDKFAAEVGLPAGYPWCAEFQSFALHKAAGKKLPIESASVAQIYSYGRAHGWLAARPLRGDIACFDFDGDGAYDDHVELVVKVLTFGPTLKLRTVGGNTSSGVAGSQADGDGVWLRTRVIARNRVAFVRIPGTVAN